MNKYRDILDQIPEEHSKTATKEKSPVAQKRKCKVSLDDEEWAELEAAAEYHHMAVSALLRTGTFAYLRQSFVIPDPERLTELQYLLAKSASNINQLVRYSHERKALTEQTIHELMFEIKQMSQAVEKALKEPRRLK